MVPRPTTTDHSEETGDSEFLTFDEFNALATEEEAAHEAQADHPQENLPSAGVSSTSPVQVQSLSHPISSGDITSSLPQPSLKVTNGIRSYKIIDPFKGDKTQDIVEFLSKFEETYGLLGWPEATKYNVLRVNIEGAPFQIVDNNVRLAKNDPEAYAQAKKVLLSRYAPSIFSTWQTAVSRTLSEGESSGDFMSELQKLFKQCLPSDFSVSGVERILARSTVVNPWVDRIEATMA
ncbi:hypothetical protein Pmar_PMAR005797 [Perkinsus marinus ATCC 50983]|uniref:Retrotransposon gag domain-containing protein n=2 Tax=Perkinsus marinus (strain ATCC 50983 / TXsc) TaxID=423536 RepID=C5KZC3_PERM5|nr:hypothetical protein Pmar_PMAR005797 [Perkinsus marinus ATCC 50983]EER10170.1 hypothetical protein Pmar_PMAR005797 [Perkinsus marinus ATCC 50983]|eukprot:XP_002778375.1 hypothetical protein Pmar_PMAR005797 [Perkinsus marinus ATCC 50983]